MKEFFKGYLCGLGLYGFAYFASAVFAISVIDILIADAAARGASSVVMTVVSACDGDSSSVVKYEMQTAAYMLAAVLMYRGSLPKGDMKASPNGWSCDVSKAGGNGSKPEVFYRTMSQSDYDYLRMTGELPPTGETFISPISSFSNDYDGVMVKFELNSGTTSMLEKIGLSNGDRAMLAKEVYPDMPYVSGVKWTENFAFFKAEGSQINIGLGKGKALEIFNSNISTFKRMEN